MATSIRDRMRKAKLSANPGMIGRPSGLGHEDHHRYLLDLPLIVGEAGCTRDKLLPEDVALFTGSDCHTHGQLLPPAAYPSPCRVTHD
jgi:hypothetical protein